MNLSANGYDPRCFTALPAGETRRFEIGDIRGIFAPLRPQGRPVASHGQLPQGRQVHPVVYLPLSQVRGEVSDGLQLRDERRQAGSHADFHRAEQGTACWDFHRRLDAAPVTITMRPMTPDDLTVHEWGVFTVFSDLKHANVNRKQEWMSMPPDFYRQFPTRRLLWIPAAWDKPIVYFYTKQPSLEIDVKVKFTEGAPVVWWPACASPIDDGMSGGKMGRPGAAREGKVFNTLRWSGWLGDVTPYDNGYQSSGQWAKVQDFELPRHGWLQDARLPNAARFTVRGTDDKWRGRFPTTRPETERFIYYDGLVPAPDYLRCTDVTEAGVTVKNTAKFPIANLFFVDRRADRKGKDWAVAHRAEPIPAGGTATIPLQAIQPGQASADIDKLARTARQVPPGCGPL